MNENFKIHGLIGLEINNTSLWLPCVSKRWRRLRTMNLELQDDILLN